MIDILVITNTEDITADFVIQKLKEHQARYYRFNTDSLFRSVSVSFNILKNEYFLIDKVKDCVVDLKKIKSVYFRRPKLPTLDVEANRAENIFLNREIVACLHGIYSALSGALWISDVNSIRRAENKIYQLSLAKKIGFTIPPTLLSNLYCDFELFSKEYDQLIIKPVSYGYIDDKHVTFTSQINKDDINEESFISFPNYIQEEIKKKVDIRITVVGENVFPVAIESQESERTKTDWRITEKPLTQYSIDLPNDIKGKCIKLVKALDLNFGAIDMVLSQNGQYYFLEINPNGQWAWMEYRLGLNISDEIAKMLLMVCV